MAPRLAVARWLQRAAGMFETTDMFEVTESHWRRVQNPAESLRLLQISRAWWAIYNAEVFRFWARRCPAQAAWALRRAARCELGAGVSSLAAAWLRPVSERCRRQMAARP